MPPSFPSSYVVFGAFVAAMARSSALRSTPSRPHGSAEWANVSSTYCLLVSGTDLSVTMMTGSGLPPLLTARGSWSCFATVV